MESPGVARSWVTEMAKFSESPLIAYRTFDGGKNEQCLNLDLVACERKLVLEFSQFGWVRIQYNDEILQQNHKISGDLWTNIVAFGNGNSCGLVFCLESGGRVEITKQLGTVAIQSFPMA